MLWHKARKEKNVFSKMAGSLSLFLSYYIAFAVSAKLDKPDLKQMRIQVESQSRDYRTGPVGGLYMMTNRDQIRLSLEHPGPDSIWRWAMASGFTSSEKICDLSRVYGHGESVSVICFGEEGVYYAYAEKIAVASLPAEDKTLISDYLKSNNTICYEEDRCLEKFSLISTDILTNDPSKAQSIVEKCQVRSDPVKIISTQYCFLWAFEIQVLGKVGYVFSEPEPTGNEGSYIRYRAYLWITASNSMSESELLHRLPQTRYAGLLTRGFKDKGLEPCMRYAHKAIELSHPTPKFVYDPLGEGIYWIQDFIARTDTTAATLSDISFTVASKQHIAIYGCFVAHTRVILDPRQFSFLSAGRNDPQKINKANSDMSDVQKQSVNKKLKHIFGHYVEYVGRPWEYESVKHRRDISVFQNPCMTLEFGFAARGVTYMAQDWLSVGTDDITQISLPRFGDDDMSLSQTGDDATESENLSHTYIKVFDFVFTPTHMVALLSDSSIFFHPTSIIYKGFGFIRSLHFYRPGALVSRRWCASTVTPKEHNMVVPIFSLNGNFVIIQILPVQETTSMWMPKPAESCLTKLSSENKGTKEKKQEREDEKNDEYTQKKLHKQQELQDTMEFCIHRKEAPKISSKLDEQKKYYEKKEKECETLLPEGSAAAAPDEKVSANSDKLDSLLTYWLAGNTLIDENDPHFIIDTGSSLKSSTSTANFNSHMSYEVDKRGAKIKELFVDHGLEVKHEERIASRKPFLWLHDVQFEAEERRYMLSVELKSDSLKKVSFSMAVLNAVIINEPIRIERGVNRKVVEVDFMFSGTLIVRLSEDESNNNERIHGTIRSFTTNTALGNYVLHMHYFKGKKPQDVILYATMDGAHARPLTYYNEPPTNNNPVEPKIRFTGQHPADSSQETGVLIPDMTMTEHGIISVLLRKANTTDTADFVEPIDKFPQSVIIGSIVVPEPLRKVFPFKGSSYVFQQVTSDGEIVYGDYSFENWIPGYDKAAKVVNGFYPNVLNVEETRFLSTPFESMLGGNDDVDKDTFDEFSSSESATADRDICPFSDFVVHNIPFDFAEVDYQTRITAEVVYRGSSIPLEADLLVEFEDSHGISVAIHSGIESRRDQTVVRKSVDIYIFLTPAAIEEMYNSPEVKSDENADEDITIFSITLRPSLVNLHCRKDLFFKTIQINVGCNPFTTMRFIAEAVGLQKIPFQRTVKDRDNKWTVTENGDDYSITIPGSKVNYNQREVFECVADGTGQRGRGYCKIPTQYAKLVKENMYSMHFSKSIVPKFEQFLTRHVRRVTGNVFLFSILNQGEVDTNTTLLDSNCHNLGPTCAPEDDSCGTALDPTKDQATKEKPWTAGFMDQIAKKELDFRSDVYKHYRSCFSNTRLSGDQDKIRLDQDLPNVLQNAKYWLFNTTNFNAFKLDKHRDMIYIIRAVVVNTPDNTFTFCQKLETFFLLQVTGVTPARRPLRWEYYLALITLVLFIFIAIYFYFARSSQWQSQVSTRRIREEEEREEREAAAKENQTKGENYAQWAKNLRKIAQDKAMGKEVDPNAVFDQTADTGLDNIGDNVGTAKTK